MYIFDGALGTMLQKAGLQEGYCPELFNIEHPEIVKDIHKQYLVSGSDIITANTFGASALKLEDYHLEAQVKELNTAAIKLAKEAIQEIKPRAKVAGSMGPTGRFIEPLGNISFDEIYNNYLTQALALIEAGTDYIIIETIIDIQEMRAAFLAASDARVQLGKSKTDVPIICQFSFSEDGRTITGTPPAAAAILLDAMGADIIGINCSLGPVQIAPMIAEMASVTNLPLIAQPNAGMPQLVNKETIFPLGPEEMAAHVSELLAAGATYIGACCGSTPNHIKEITKAVKAYNGKARPTVPAFTALTSRTKVITFGQDQEPLIIGERINPTGRKKLAQELQNGSFVMVKHDALAQVKAGASILDVNMGVAGIDQSSLMGKAICELTMLVDTPLSIDTLDSKALEIGLKNYPGRALINSVNAEPEQIEAVMPLAKRYGAALLCLPLSSGDLPAKAEDRLALATTIVEQAYAHGLRPNDLLLDPLVLTLASGNESAKETLKTLRLYKEKFGFPTVMGLSNISFGMPQRPYLNAHFLTMALVSGLTLPILNPLNYTVKKAFIAAKTLLGFDPGAATFIKEYAQEVDIPTTNNASAPFPNTTSTPTALNNGNADSLDAYNKDLREPIAAIKNCVEQGEKEAIIPIVEKALDEGINPLDITKQGLSEAMNVVGEKFGNGTLFLPQVMLAAETMQAAFQTIKRVLPAEDSLAKETIIIATVKGDIHDLGKNIVGALLENNGYHIIDLGKDVSAEEIISAIKTHKASLVGICSLMTTTMPQIDNTIEAIRQAGLDTKIMVGGAVLTQEYADQAGADAYAKDGITAVNLAKKLLDSN